MAATAAAMEYIGCSSIQSVETIRSDAVTPKQFFSKYVSTRTPVKFADHIADKAWKVSSTNWSHSYLRSKCGKEVKVKVEYRSDSNDKFGQAKEVTMTFHKFLDEIEKGADTLYLTTQNLDIDGEDRPSIMAAPLTSLRSDFPLVPELFQTLVPANLNLWYGQSAEFSTSGLHHDFHDNLYIMLKGEKRITLFPPSEIDNLYLAGEVVKVHTNGRICYKGKLTRADGADLQADKALLASRKLRAAAQKLVEASQNDEIADDAEDELDRALEAVLDAECDEADDSAANEESDDDEDMSEDPFDCMVHSLEEGEEDDEGDDDEEEEEEDEEEETEEAGNDSVSKKRKSVFGEGTAPTKRSSSESVVAAPKPLPDNFSRIDTRLPLQDLQHQYPRYVSARERAVQVVVRAGEMLFIPAGWFHEVQSRGKEGHMAFNYWFHPPDNFMSGEGSQGAAIPFDKPYVSDFWAKELEERGML